MKHEDHEVTSRDRAMLLAQFIAIGFMVGAVYYCWQGDMRAAGLLCGIGVVISHVGYRAVGIDPGALRKDAFKAAKRSVKRRWGSDR